MSTNRPAGRGERSWAVSAWPLRRKVALALAVPLLLAGTLGGLRVQSDLVEASNSSSSAQQVGALRPAVDYLVAAEHAMVTALGDEGADQAVLESALEDVRAAGRELLESKEGAGLTEDQRYQVDAVLDLSRALRADDAVDLSPGVWVAQLRQLQSGVTRLITEIVNEQINPEPRLELLSHALAGRFSLAMQQALVATDRTGETSSLELFSEMGVEGAAIDRLAGALGAGESTVASLRTANAQRFRTVRTGGTDLGGADAYAGYDEIIQTLQGDVDAELAAAAAEARADAALNAAITLAALGAAVLLALLISRLLINPIHRVREGALAVAHERLPEAVARIRAGDEPGDIAPIDVTTQEEIGQLARAVDDMHRQAVVLASAEAGLRSQVSQMFVTLSRRNTSLVNQQLGLIERLERDEEDPKRLESLFRLDHLAARMRRTADSLLILADAPTTATVPDGLTVGDALQAATAGVQDYQRVRVRSADPMRIAPAAAADVVHLLTELVDNALSYSPPTSTVTLTSRATTQGVLVEIADAGLGIPAEELATLNATLRSGAEVTPETARRMGLFVVSRLSQRHGLTTRLQPNDDGGTTATVLLTSTVLPDLAPPPPVEAPAVPAAAAPARPAAALPTRPTAEPRPVPAAAAPASPAAEPSALPAAAVPTRPTAEPRPVPAAASAEEEPAPRKRRGLLKKRSKPVPERSAAGSEGLAVMDLRARIDAACGLPVREPGRALETTSAAAPATPPAAPPVPATAAAAAASPPALLPVPPPEDVPAPALAAVPEAASPVALHEARQRTSEKAAPESPDAAAQKAPTEVAPAPGSDAGPAASSDTRPTSHAQPDSDADANDDAEPDTQPDTDTPGASLDAVVAEVTGLETGADPVTASVPAPMPDALDGDWQDNGDEGFDTPIFRTLRSAWLSSDGDAQPWRTSEIEAGWEMADQVAETSEEPETSPSGLPRRRPGRRLVPGGVSPTPTVTVRDPETIRARLSAHAAGVSRGRAAATTPNPTPPRRNAGS